MTSQTVQPMMSAEAPKTLWKRLDRVMGYVMFSVVVCGGVIAPFAFYTYAKIFH